MRYLFPPNNRACKCSYISQSAKIREEARETQEAAYIYTMTNGSQGDEDNRKLLLMETLDVIHACESMLRKFDQAEVDAAFRAVLEKNCERGDYDEQEPGDR